MNLRQATRYAIWVTVHLASQPGEHMSASHLAQIYDISQHHLAKVIRVLAIARIVSSTRGPGGGCTFVADPKKVTLYDIIALFEVDLPGGEEDAALSTDNAYKAEISRVLGEIDRITLATLQSVTIQTLLNNAERQAGRRQAPLAQAVTDTTLRRQRG